MSDTTRIPKPLAAIGATGMANLPGQFARDHQLPAAAEAQAESPQSGRKIVLIAPNGTFSKETSDTLRSGFVRRLRGL